MQDAVLKLSKLIQKAGSCLTELNGFLLQPLRICRRQALYNTVHRTFELPPAIEIALQNTDAKRLQLSNHMIPKNPQCLRRVTRDQHALPVSKQVPHEIGDGMRFASSWRTLNQDAAVLFQSLRDFYLLLVRGLAQQNICVGRFLPSGLARIFCRTPS